MAQAAGRNSLPQRHACDSMIERAGTQIQRARRVMQSIRSNKLIHWPFSIRNARRVASSADRNITLTVGYRQARGQLEAEIGAARGAGCPHRGRAPSNRASSSTSPPLAISENCRRR